MIQYGLGRRTEAEMTQETTESNRNLRRGNWTELEEL